MSTIAEKEQFVTGHAGTSVVEIIWITFVPVLLLATSRILLHVWSPSGASRRLLEIAMLVLPQVLGLMGVITPGWLALLLFLVTAVTMFIAQRASAKRKAATQSPSALDMRCVFAAYRASLMVITTISILGVDFHAFPRRYAKAETYGTGLMDAGVGSIVMASAVPHGWQLAAGLSLHGHNVWREFTRLVALLTIGIGRVVFILLSGYQHHVGEYGVHWNFFMTLAAVRILQLSMPRSINTSGIKTGILGTVILIVYQVALSKFGLVDFLHSDIRGTDWFTANKEGIVTVIGYLCLSMMGTGCGALLHHLSAGSLPSDIHWRRKTWGRNSGSDSQSILVSIMKSGIAKSNIMMCLLWLLYWVVQTLVEPVSRRACNAAYVLWMLALNFQSVLSFVAAEILAEGRPLPQLLYDLNMSMLPVFLIANLFTGLVNMSMDTLVASHAVAVLVVSAYMIAVSGVATALKKFVFSRNS